MKNPSLSRGARLRSLAAAGTVAAALVLVGCSGGAAEETAPAEEETASSGSALDARLAEYLAPREAYEMPTEEIADNAALEGKTVHYVPITLQAPQFALTSELLGSAVSAAGAKLQVCNGDGNPTTISACIDSAKNDANTGGIITDGWYYGMAANSLNAAQEAGVPIVYGNQFAEDQFPQSETLANVNSPGTEMASSVLTWAAVDSGETGNVLFIKSADGPGTVKFATEAAETFAADCPECTYTEIEVTTATSSQLEGELNTKLLQDPNIGYIVPQFAQYLPTVIPTTRASGSQAQIATTAAALGALQAVAGGDVAAASGQSVPFGAWAFVDTLLRMVNGQETFDYTLPTRLFTADNIGDVDVSETAEASGEWYGPTDFPESFKKLWGRA